MRRDGRSLEEGQTFFVTRVLVAEDDPINLRIVTRMLERLGCRTDAVSSGPEILATLARTNYNLVLMNVEMPEIDGSGFADIADTLFALHQRSRIAARSR